MTCDPTFQNYRNLLEKIDTLVAGIMQKHGSSFQCHPGCNQCCVEGISVWRVEGDYMRKHITSIASQNTEHSSHPHACCFLNAEGLCAIYESRPIVCRLWGAPLMLPQEEARAWNLMPSQAIPLEGGRVMTCCNLNFQSTPSLEEITPDAAIDLQKVLTLLAAINHVYCQQQGSDPTERIPLAALFA